MTHPHAADEPVRPAAASLKIAYAVARQRAQDLHFHGVMELIERCRGEVAAPGALSIYARVHHLGEQETQALKNRVMVHMGRSGQTDIQHLPNTFVAIDGAVEWDINASLVDRIRKRVGGRRRHALREWIEMHTGHVEMQLLRAHAESLRDVREAAGPDVRLRDAVRAYAHELGVPDGMADALYFALMEQLFANLSRAETGREKRAAGTRSRDPGHAAGTADDRGDGADRRQA